MTTSQDVRLAVVQALQQIKTANGYENELSDSHIYGYYSASVVDNQSDDLYPKCFVVMERGSNSRLVGEQESRTLDFIIIVVVKALDTTQNSQEMTESYLQDLERLFFLQHNLFGAVLSASVVEFSTDSGILSPEGAVVMRIRTERM